MLMKVQLPDGEDASPKFTRGGSRLDARLEMPPDGHAADMLSEHCADSTVQLLEAEQRLYARGVSGPSAYLIATGILRFERTTEAGSRRIIRVAGHPAVALRRGGTPTACSDQATQTPDRNQQQQAIRLHSSLAINVPP